MSKHKSKNENVALENIVKVNNFRLLRKEKDVTGLSLSIEESGLQEPLWVHRSDDGTYETIRGHRRRNALLAYQQRNPELFAKTFGKGIPCKVFTDLKRVDIEGLKLDSGNTVELADPFEVQMYLNTLFDNGVNMEQAKLAAAALLDRVWPATGKTLEELKKLQAALDKEIAGGDAEKIADAQAAYNKRYKSSRHGKMQNCKALYNGPTLLMAAYYNHANMELPPAGSRYFVGDNRPMPKRWTMDKAAELSKAHQQDIDAAKVDGTMVTKDEPGPIFKQAWNEWVAEIPEEKVKPPRSMSHKDIEEKSQSYLSRVARKAAMIHAGNGTPDGFPEDDRRAAIGEMIAEINPALWEQVEKAYTDHKNAQAAEAAKQQEVDSEKAEETAEETAEVKG
jgi:hypothetical protein